MKCVLSIAATDSSCGAGTNADLKVFADTGVYGLSAVTCVTAQNSMGVHRIYKIPPRIVMAQIDTAAEDFEISACKIGMLFSPPIVEKVAERIIRRDIKNAVLDPVMKAKDGKELLTQPAIKRMRRRLLPQVRLVTPNADEAECLSGIEVVDLDSAKEAARIIHDFGPEYVMVKGGHIEGEPVDILYDGSSFIEYTSPRLERNMHGTGCVLSAAITARLALGDEMPLAVMFAKDYISKAIENSVSLGKGKMQFFTPGLYRDEKEVEEKG